MPGPPDTGVGGGDGAGFGKDRGQSHCDEPQREGGLSVNRTQRYDAAIIGAGQGEKPLVIAMAAAGYRTAIIEREHVGGAA